MFTDKCKLIMFVLVVALMASTTSHAAEAAWKGEWERAVAEAKNEGQVVLYGGYNPVYRDYIRLFEAKYPDIRVDFIPGGGSQHAVRILSERRGGQYLADVVMGGASTFQNYPDGTFDPLRPFLLLPEVTDESAWFGGRLPFVDADGQYVLTAMGSLSQELAYNTKLVDPDEINSWRDLLDPKWKGKIARLKRKGVSATFLFFYHTPELGPKFISQLFEEAKIGQTENLRQGVNWLAEGKYALFLDATPQSIDEAKERGLPVDILTKPLAEGQVLSGAYCCMAVLNRAPHPNATKVLVNWILSKEGQSAWQAAVRKNSLRVDIPKDDVPPAIVPKKGGKYFHSDSSVHTQPQHLEAIKKLIKEGEK